MAGRTSNAVRGHAGISLVTRGGHRRYMVSYRVEGRQKTKSFRTQKEAVDFQAGMRDPMRRRQLQQLEAGRIPLKTYFPEWLERKRNLATSTRRSYRDAGNNYILPGLGEFYVASIVRDDVEEWISDLVDREVGPPTIDKSYRTLRACLETASLDGKAVGNPARRISVPENREREPFFLDEDQVDAVAGDVADRYRALVYFLAYTGARIGEASALRVKNLRLLEERVQIVESAAEVAGRKLPSGKTKTKKTRSINLGQELCAELGRHLEQYGVRSGSSLDPESLVFTGDRGAAVRQGNWRVRSFQASCVRLGIVRTAEGEIEAPRVHDLRHTAASLAAKAGYSLHEVKEMLGHSTIKTTSDRYLHLFDDTRRQCAGSLDALMREARGNTVEVVQDLDVLRA